VSAAAAAQVEDGGIVQRVGIKKDEGWPPRLYFKPAREKKPPVFYLFISQLSEETKDLTVKQKLGLAAV
jgi:hypothetical protein